MPQNVTSPYGISAQPESAYLGVEAANATPPQIQTSPSSFPLTTDMIQGQMPMPMNPSN